MEFQAISPASSPDQLSNICSELDVYFLFYAILEAKFSSLVLTGALLSTLKIFFMNLYSFAD